MSIGENIKRRRMELKLSQRELSDRMGYSNHSTITRIEAGKVDISQSKVVKFAEALNTTPAVLMGWEKEKPAIAERAAFDAAMAKDEDLREMVKKYMALPEDKKKTVKQMIEDYYDAFA